jgi:hypothetical protein
MSMSASIRFGVPVVRAGAGDRGLEEGLVAAPRSSTPRPNTLVFSDCG